MMEIRTLSFIHEDDICATMDVDSIREFSVFRNCDPGFFYLDTSWDAVQEYIDEWEDMTGTTFEKYHANTVSLVEYLRENMGIRDGIDIYIGG